MSPAVARSRSEAERGEDTRGEEVHNAYKVHQNMKRSPRPQRARGSLNLHPTGPANRCLGGRRKHRFLR